MVRASLELPAGSKIVAPVGVTVSREPFEYQSTYDLESNRIRTERRLRTRGSEITAAAAGEYLATVRAVRADEAQQVEITFDMTAVPAIPADATVSELYSAGDAIYDTGNYNAAAAFFERTVELEPKHKEGWDALVHA